jgi:hypothetical protein
MASILGRETSRAADRHEVGFGNIRMAPTGILALLLSLQSPTDAVTGDFGVIRADLLVKALAQKGAWPIAPGANLGRDFIYVNVKDLALDDAKSILARLTQGKWVERGGVSYLNGGPVSDAFLQSVTRRSVAKLFEDKSPQTPFNSQSAKDFVSLSDDLVRGAEDGRWDWTKRQSAAKKAPMHRAITGLIRLIGEPFFASFPENGRVVFSATPTRMQRALPPGSAAVLSQLFEEARILRIAAEQFSRTDPQQSYSGVTQTYMSFPKVMKGADLVVQSTMGGLTVTLRLAGDDGENWAVTENRNLLSEAFERNPADPENSKKKPSPPFSEFSEPIPLSPAGRARISFFGDLGLPGRGSTKSPADDPKVTAELLKAITNPQNRDLLDVYLDEALDLLAAKTGKGLIAPVSDGTFFQLPSPDFTYAALGLALGISPLGDGQAALEALGGNQALIPADIKSHRSFRANRAAVATLVKGLNSEAALLDVMADFALTDPGVSTLQFSTLIAPKVSRRMPPIFLDEKSLILLKVYAMLPPQLRAGAHKDNVMIPLRGVGPKVVEDLHRFVFEQEGTVVGPAQQEMLAQQQGQQDAGRAYTDPFQGQRHQWITGTYSTEPTRRLGNGIPHGTMIRVRVRREPVIFASTSDERQYFGRQPLDVNQLAATTVLKERAVNDYGWRVPDQFENGFTTLVSISLLIPNGDRVDGSVTIDESPADGKKLKMQEMPEAFQKAVQEAIAAQRKSMENLTFGDGRRPPP